MEITPQPKKDGFLQVQKMKNDVIDSYGNQPVPNKKPDDTNSISPAPAKNKTILPIENSSLTPRNDCRQHKK